MNPSKIPVAIVALSALLVAAALSAYPAAEGFDAEGSDPEAIAIADAVMESMGGWEAWNATRYVSWNFFGLRSHLWDKWTGDVRFTQGDRVILFNVHSRDGKVYDGEDEVTGDAVAGALKMAYEAWINDSYWLFMPYKLKDSGVTLRFVGEGTLDDGRPADVLQLTFEGVGVTPQNKYHVFVSKDRRLVEKWSFFAQATDEEPRFSTPWADWREHGDILLSGDRGQRQISDIRVLESVPTSAFRLPDALGLDHGAGGEDAGAAGR